jgi:hypothetical protein
MVALVVVVQRVYQAGERRWGTDENTFNMVLASQSYEQLRAVFDAYHKVSGKDIEHAIRSEMSGDLATGMLTIGQFLIGNFLYNPLLCISFLNDCCVLQYHTL